MATYVILAGATAGGWYMRPLANRLQKAGHDVFTPTYTGLGERSHLLNPDIDLETHIQDVLQVFKYEDLKEVILVGKSYSGMVITGVADRIPDRIRHLVYLDAAVPEDGQSLLDLLDPAVTAMLLDIIQAYGEGWYLPADLSVNERLTHQPHKTGIQPLRLRNQQAIARIPHTYIYCTQKTPDSLAGNLTQSGMAKAKANNWNYFELATGHEPEQEAPDEVAAILLQLAQV